MTCFLIRLARRFMSDRRGNVAMIVALCAVPLFGMLGFAIDYGIALSDKSKLDNAADAATLAAINAAQAVLQSQGSTATSAAQAAGQTAGNAAFMANAGRLAFISNYPAPTLNVTATFPNVAATLSYAYSVPTSLSRIVGIGTVLVQGKSRASLAMTTYINYYILVDVSQSMGIGATQTDMTNLYNRSASLSMVNGGCVFGCHVASPGDSYSMEYVAHNMSPRITLRIDSAVTAIQDVISQAQTNAGSSGTIKIGLYTMDGYPMSGTRLNTISAPSSNYSSLMTLASTIDLGPNNGSVGYGDSAFSLSIPSFNSLLPSQGDGSSASEPINYVVIITDGVEDDYGSSCVDTHCASAFASSLCYPLQAKAKVGVIYTTYIPIYTDNVSTAGYDVRYLDLVYPFATQISPNLQACASSSSLFFEASDGPALISALSQLFASTTQVAHITQ